jgi:hypothetical protein
MDPNLVKNSAKLLSVLSRKDNLNIFVLADNGGSSNSNNNDDDNKSLAAKTSTIQKLGLSRKVYYTRLKQLINAGLIEKSDGVYKHTTLGNIIYQNHILNLMEHLKNTKQMKMVDTLKHTKQFSEEEIANFVSKITGGAACCSGILSSNSSSSGAITTTSSTKIEVALTYPDMVSAIVERVEFCKNEILLASRSLNEIIINNILRKANSSSITVKVLTDSSLVEQYFKTEGETLMLKEDDDSGGAGSNNNDKKRKRRNAERINVVSNPWYPGNVNRRIAKIPFSMIILDGKEVGFEIVNWNEPKNFYGVVFIREDEKSLKVMQDLYYKIWNNASSSSSSSSSSYNHYRKEKGEEEVVGAAAESHQQWQKQLQQQQIAESSNNNSNSEVVSRRYYYYNHNNHNTL